MRATQLDDNILEALYVPSCTKTQSVKVEYRVQDQLTR